MARSTPDDAFMDDLIIPAVDGFSLTGTLFLPRGKRTHAALISAAIGTPRSFYRNFAAYLATRGFAVLTYDYRGTGDSLPKDQNGKKSSSRRDTITLSDWAAKDTTAAIAWMRGRYSDIPLSHIGHSFGGLALGLASNNADVSRALHLATQTGPLQTARFAERMALLGRLKYAGLPASRILGYVPGSLGVGVDLPRGAAEQWLRWLTSEKFLFDDHSVAGLSNFANFTGALRILSFTDDAWTTEDFTSVIRTAFTATWPEMIRLRPQDVGTTSVGHTGFFDHVHRDTLWRGSAEWLESGDGLSRAALRA